MALLWVELEVESRKESGEEDALRHVVVELERTLEGWVRWDLEEGHLHSAELEARGSFSVEDVRRIQGRDGDVHELSQTESYEGTLSYQVEVTRE